MAQQLLACTALAEDSGSVLSTRIKWLTTPEGCDTCLRAPLEGEELVQDTPRSVLSTKEIDLPQRTKGRN